MDFSAGVGWDLEGFNCLLGCKNPAMWERTYAMGNPSSKWFSYCLRPVETCAKLEAHLNGGFAEAENMLDESGSVGYHNLTVRFRPGFSRHSRCPTRPEKVVQFGELRFQMPQSAGVTLTDPAWH